MQSGASRMCRLTSPWATFNHCDRGSPFGFQNQSFHNAGPHYVHLQRESPLIHSLTSSLRNMYRGPKQPPSSKLQPPLDRQFSLWPNGAELRPHGVVEQSPKSEYKSCL